MTTITTKEKDYLENDPPIRNQNFCCLSFISPEDILIEKKTFLFSKFVEKFSSDMGFLIENLKLKYKDDVDTLNNIKQNHAYIFNVEELNEQFKFYSDTNSEELEDEFHKLQDFTTTIRGLKIRGAYNTIEEAKKRCEQLKKIDSKFDIYVSEIGAWIPMAPPSSEITDQEYSETQLNTLMSKYNKNKEDKDIVFSERNIKVEAGSKIMDENVFVPQPSIISDTNITSETEVGAALTEKIDLSSKETVFTKSDPWMDQKHKK
jgi:hypothetical protein